MKPISDSELGRLCNNQWDRSCDHKLVLQCSKGRVMASRESRRRLKREALARYSRGKIRCHWCKDDDVDVLSIDHKRNDGAEERRLHGKRGHAFYQWLKGRGWPKGYAVLCFSCNFSKHVNGGRVSLYRFRKRKRW